MVKVVGPDDPGYSPQACERLEREARIGFRVNHPSVVRVLDVHRVDTTWYLVMEFADGASLAEVLEDCGRMGWMQVAQIGARAADGLAAIHRAGLLHRDIKPANILLQPDGAVKIADLGLAAPLAPDSEGQAATEGGVVGTPPYVPPEQRTAAGRLSERADVYALGATLYHLLAGHQPQRSKSPLAYLTGQEEYEPIVWDPDVTPPVPEWFRDVVETCLAQSSEQRFYDAAGLNQVLVERVQSPAPSASKTPPERAARPRGIAVLPFANRRATADEDWVGDVLADHAGHRIVGVQGLHLMDRHELASLIERLCSRPPQQTPDAQLRRACELAGVSTVIRGSFALDGDSASVEAYALDISNGKTRPVLREQAPLSAILGAEVDFGDAVIQALGYSGAPRVSDRTLPSGTSNTTAQKWYAEGQRAFARGDYPRAIECAEAALEADPEFADLIGFIGVCHARQGQYDAAIEYHKRLKALADERDDPYHLAEAVSNMGVMYYFKGDYNSAYELLTSANRLEQELNLLPILSKNYSNLGFVLSKLERLEEADQAFREAVRIMTELGTLSGLISPYNGRGEVALQRGRYQEATQHYQTALEWATKTEDQVNVGICHVNLGRCACHLGALDRAEEHFRTALGLLESTSFWHGLALVYEHQAELHLLRDRVDAALQGIEERIKLAQRHKNRRIESAAWEQKARAYEIAGQTETAVDCLRKSFEISRRDVPAGDLYEYLEAIARRIPFGPPAART